MAKPTIEHNKVATKLAHELMANDGSIMAVMLTIGDDGTVHVYGKVQDDSHPVRYKLKWNTAAFLAEQLGCITKGLFRAMRLAEESLKNNTNLDELELSE